MQLTKFDRWLREKFAQETHIHVLRLPDQVPRGIKIINLPEAPGARFRHLLVTRNSVAADKLIATLKQNSQMYSTQIVERKGLLVRLLAPKEKSVTWWLISWSIILACSVVAGQYLLKLLSDPDIQKNLREALEILKG